MHGQRPELSRRQLAAAREVLDGEEDSAWTRSRSPDPGAGRQARRLEEGTPCEHAFVTSQGHAHARFRRALLTKNLKLIEAASRELQHVGLDDALRVLVVFAERRDARYERAAARFVARVMLERRLGLAEARYVLALAEALPRSPDAVALLLRPYCG